MATQADCRSVGSTRARASGRSSLRTSHRVEQRNFVTACGKSTNFPFHLSITDDLPGNRLRHAKHQNRGLGRIVRAHHRLGRAALRRHRRTAGRPHGTGPGHLDRGAGRHGATGAGGAWRTPPRGARARRFRPAARLRAARRDGAGHPSGEALVRQLDRGGMRSRPRALRRRRGADRPARTRHAARFHRAENPLAETP